VRDEGGTVVLRHAVRALVVDPRDDAVLLVRMQFTVGGPRVWLTPGGGIDPGESPEAALRRELHEETGLRLDGVPCTGPVWTRRARFTHRGVAYDQRERYYLVEHPRFEPDASANPAASEVEAFRGFRWWTPDALAATGERFTPTGFRTHYGRLRAQGPPPVPVHVDD
jgi:8-oxo-dGTP pyrophosphatase MutT (NUDIX family)